MVAAARPGMSSCHCSSVDLFLSLQLRRAALGGSKHTGTIRGSIGTSTACIEHAKIDKICGAMPFKLAPMSSSQP